MESPRCEYDVLDTDNRKGLSPSKPLVMLMMKLLLRKPGCGILRTKNYKTLKVRKDQTWHHGEPNHSP